MSRVAENRASWWGELPLAENETARWRIGPLELAVRRGADEWQVAYEWDPARPDSQDWELERDTELLGESAQHERFVIGGTGNRIMLRPLLADRPVVSRPRLPFHLLPERDITLFVGSPVWVRLEAGEPPTLLRELPSHRPSDTWFGGNTREGELCYATETRALLHLENMPVLNRSAVTPVRIRNRAPSSLFLERLKLPVPLLAIYSDQNGRLWTEGVTLTRSEESDMAVVEVRPGPPAAGTTPITPARQTPDTGLWTRAFSSLLALAPTEEDR